MKRIFALLLVLTLFCPSALAETIRQQVNAPESLQDTFTSNTGRMTIDIKADVIVPDISTLYEIDVTPRLFNDEELSRLVKGFQQTDSQLDADYQVLFGISRLYEYKNAHIHLIASGTEDNGTWSDVTAKCVVSDETYLTGYMSVLQRMHEGPAAHCRYTLEEAKAIADQAAAIVAPNYAFSAWGLMELYPRDGSDTRTKDYDYLEGYQFCYTPVLEGIQILYIIGTNLCIPKAILPCATLGRMLGDWPVCEPVGIGDIASLINLLNNDRLNFGGFLLCKSNNRQRANKEQRGNEA